MLVEADLPDNPALLRAMLVEARGEIAQQQALIADLEGAGTDARAEIKRLTAIIAAFQRRRFGARHGPSSSIPTSWRSPSRNSTRRWPA